MTGTTIKVEGLVEVDAAVESLAQHAGDMRSLATAISTAWYVKEKGWLDSGGRGSFPGLTEEYAKTKAQKYGEQPILKASGAMDEALTGKDSPDSVYLVTENELTVGVAGRSGQIASYHQKGEGNLPARHVYDDLIIDEFKSEELGLIAVGELTEYARSISLRVV
ncbi:MAG: hypothetical protein QOH63_1984 [Acidobacteriota bacterium]|jgi:phage gpG-like protein|nr:hypothetical protein [Acidobacteriota bacterium]